MTERKRVASDKIGEKIAALAPWFHNIHLPTGHQTRPEHNLGDFPQRKWDQLSPYLPDDLSGWHALDVGCNAGFYTIELVKRGAHVTAIDVDERYLKQAKWVAEQFGVSQHITFREMQVYDLARTTEQFDLVLFMGVLYHLRYPMLGLDIVREKVRKLLVFQTLLSPGGQEEDGVAPLNLKMVDRDALRADYWPKLAFIEHRFANDPTNWWIPNRSAVLAMARSTGLRLLHDVGYEMFVFEPNPDHPQPMRTWNRDEYLNATGQFYRSDNGAEGQKGQNGADAQK